MEIVKVAKRSGKLENFRSIDTNTLTNEFCMKMHNSPKQDIICTKCYSFALLEGLRKNCVASRQHNSDVLSKGIIPPHMLETYLDAFMRFSADGELINITHLENLHNITMHNPHCSFALWTKRKSLINQFYDKRDKPKNLILIYSNARIDTVMKSPPKHFDRTFNNVTKENFVEQQNCTGQKCKNCLLCYTPNNGVSTIVEAVKKY
tara:strand:+ start:2613 stop:3230 length:618 start_codon:yes stop_codon:yes gene_type:complete